MQYHGNNCNGSIAIIAVYYFQYHPTLVYVHTHTHTRSDTCDFHTDNEVKLSDKCQASIIEFNEPLS